MPSSVSACAQVLTVGALGALMAHLKGMSMSRPDFDARACEDAIAVGAECSLCQQRFKFCQGHFVYEPITVILFDAFGTVMLSAALTCSAMGWRAGREALTSKSIALTVAPVGLIYIFGDVAELLAMGLSSPMTVAVVAQSRMLLVALMRWLVLGKRQTLVQWIVLWTSCGFCILSLKLDGNSKGSVIPMSGKELLAVPLVLVKNLISCGGAVFSEYFLQHQETKSLPISATQFHFKAASAVSSIGIVAFQGSAARIFASEWNPALHSQMPPGTMPGHKRMPFFGGWNLVTCMLAGLIIANNFVIGSTLRQLSSVCKYAASSFTFALTYVIAVMSGARPLSFPQLGCCSFIAVLVVVYAMLPQPKQIADDKAKSS